MRKSPWRIGTSRGAWTHRLLGTALLVGLTLIMTHCGGGGSSGGGSFDVVEFSASLQTQRVYLNDPIVITFSQPVDPQTVYSGLYIYPSASAGSKRAQGEFQVDGNKVTFRPNLPTDNEFTNGGFVPDTQYTICVPAPNASCSVYIQNSPGLRTAAGRGITTTRTESFRTRVVNGGQGAFRPEVPARRPEVVQMVVADAEGVTQVLNPIINLIHNQEFVTGILSTVVTTPSTLAIPQYHYTPTVLVKKVTASVQGDPGNPYRFILSNPSQAITPDEFKDRGGLITIRDSSTPEPVEASWAIESNGTSDVIGFASSGPKFSEAGFTTPPFTAEISQGLTRQVAPGDVNAASEIKITFSEALSPLTVTLDNFKMYRLTDTTSALQFDEIAPGSTLTGSQRPGITHEVTNGQSVVTLRPKASFPLSKPGETATVVVWINTNQLDNSVPPAVKAEGVRDLNNYALAYPKRTGWVLAMDAASKVTTVAYIDPLPYTNGNPSPANIQVMYAFQTRADAKVTNAVVETFVDRQNVAKDCATTAAWTKAGQAGLYATYGYGGNGELGDQNVTGAIVIDTDAMTPGADGVVELNYNKLVVSAGGTITCKGLYPLRLNALDSIEIYGTIDASGQPGANAPSGVASQVGRISGGRGGPGAGAGGDSNTNPLHPIGALPMELRGGPGYPKAATCADLNRSDNRLITVIEPNCGGGTGGNRGVPSGTLYRSGCSGNGGGHLQDGIQTDYLCSNIGAFGREFGVKWVATSSSPNVVTEPTGGTGGGAGGNAAISTSNPSPAHDIVAGSGGGGGGGIELVSAGNLEVKAGANILAAGGSGGNGYSTLAGSTTVAGGFGAGGSGGDVWLSGTSVTVEAGSTVDAQGGIGNPNPPSPSRTGDGGDGYIIIRDLGKSPLVQSGANVDPAFESTRTEYAPTTNGQSVAVSAWYDSGENAPSWSFDASNPSSGEVVGGKDLTWINQPQAGQTVKIMFQGSPDDGGKAFSDPTKWYPTGNTPAAPCAVWETDINKLKNQGNLRHIRFKVEFSIGARQKAAPPPNQVSISRIVINYEKPTD